MAFKINYNYHFALAAIVITAILGMIFVGSVRDHKRLTNPDTARKQGRPLPVVVATALSQELMATTAAECQVVAGNSFTISSQAGTKITRILVEAGDRVAPGDLLVTLNNTVLQKQLHNALEAEKSAAEHADFMASYMQDLVVLEKRKLLPIVEMLRAREDIAQAKRVLSQARQNVIDLQHQLNETRIIAAREGMVASISMHQGATPKSFDTILEIAQLDPLQLDCEFADTSIAALRQHDTALATFPAFPGKQLRAEFQSIQPAPSLPGQSLGQNLLLGHFKISNAEQQLMPGIQAVITLQKSMKGITIPANALMNQRAEQAETFVMDQGNRVQLRSLRLGEYAEGYVEVLDGVSANEKVVVAGQMYLQHGDEVRVTAETGGANAQPH